MTPSAAEIRRALPAGTKDLVARIVREADAADVAVGLVGGPVRDLLLGRAIRDVDLVLEPAPGHAAVRTLEIAKAAAGAAGRVTDHANFLTARIETETCRVDLATTRSERYASAGALPEVAPASLAEDLRRRDFTVNAMVLPLGRVARSRWSGMVDPGSARKDLERKVLRVFHPRSFHDDPTRALRAARFASRFGFRLARSSGTALRDAMRDGAFGAVAGERYRAEFEKLFDEVAVGGDPVRALRWLAEAHVLSILEPGLRLPDDAVANLRRLARGAPASAGAGASGFDVASDPRWLSALMLWLAPLPAPLRRRVLARIAVTGRASERIRGFARLRERTLRRLAAARGRGAVDTIVRPLAAAEWSALRASAPADLRRRIDRHHREDRDRVLPITGDDLVAAGLQGPAVGRALEAVRIATINGVVKSREDAMALAGEVARGRRRGK